MLNKEGFTLVELSIVIVILGLLVGGIIVGSNLVHNAELRSTISDIERYMQAINTFKDKYKALPGDMPNATSFWGEAHATPATCITTIGSDTETCNGDGDGRINDFSESATLYERFRAWQHLSNAGMIEGSFNGVADVGTDKGQPGTNVPGSALGEAIGFGLNFNPVTTGTANFYAGDYGNTLSFGISGGSNMLNAGVSTQDAWHIDQKIDEGRPAYGMVLSQKPGGGVNANCSTSDTASSAVYDFSVEGPQCALLIRTRF